MSRTSKNPTESEDDWKSKLKRPEADHRYKTEVGRRLSVSVDVLLSLKAVCSNVGCLLDVLGRDTNEGSGFRGLLSQTRAVDGNF